MVETSLRCTHDMSRRHRHARATRARGRHEAGSRPASVVWHAVGGASLVVLSGAHTQARGARLS